MSRGSSSSIPRVNMPVTRSRSSPSSAPSSAPAAPGRRGSPAASTTVNTTQITTTTGMSTLGNSTTGTTTDVGGVGNGSTVSNGVNTTNGTGASSSAATPSPAQTNRPANNPMVNWNTNILSEKDKLSQIGTLFSKIATRYQMESVTMMAHKQWELKFLPVVDKYGLRAWLEQYNVPTSNKSLDEQLEVQRVLFHMIMECLPSDDLVLSQLVYHNAPAHERTGFHAFRALKNHFQGDSTVHLTKVEQEFNSLKWQEKEDFPSFIARFTSIVSELSTLDPQNRKPDRILKAKILSAIQDSSRLDSDGQPVFVMMNVVNMMNRESNYQKWLAEISREAQQIQEAIARKRKRSSAASPSPSVSGELEIKEAHKVESDSSVRPSPNKFQRRFDQNGVRSDGNKPTCRYWQKGSCRSGDRCAFPHPARAGGAGSISNNSANHNGIRANNFNYKNQKCFDFQRGRCARGANCRYSHAGGGLPSSSGGRSFSGGGGRPSSPHPQSAEMKSNQRTAFDDDTTAVVYVIEAHNSIGSSSSRDEPRPHRILMDSCASDCMTPRLEYIVGDLFPLHPPIHISGAFGKKSVATHYGAGYIPILGGKHAIKVKKLIYCAALHDTLLCAIDLSTQGYSLLIENGIASFSGKVAPNIFSIMCHNKRNLTEIPQKAREQGGEHSLPTEHTAYVTTRAQAAADQVLDVPQNGQHLSLRPSASSSSSSTSLPNISSSSAGENSSTFTVPLDSLVYHHRIGHICASKLRELYRFGAADGLLPLSHRLVRTSLGHLCATCSVTKMTRLKFSTSAIQDATLPNHKAVADYCGAIVLEVTIVDGVYQITKYGFSGITDVYSRCFSGMIVTNKADCSHHLIQYWWRTQHVTGRRLVHAHMDGGTEYNRAEAYLESKGTLVTRTPSYSPACNGIAERKNRTINDLSRTLLHQAGLPVLSVFYSAAFYVSVHIHNRVTVVSSLEKTQHELFTGIKPNLSHFRSWGCDCTVKIPSEKVAGKMDVKAEIGIFIGMDDKRRGCYRVLLEDKTPPHLCAPITQHNATDQLPAAAASSSSSPHMHPPFCLSLLIPYLRIAVSRDVIFMETSFTVRRADWKWRGEQAAMLLAKLQNKQKQESAEWQQAKQDAEKDYRVSSNSRVNAMNDALDEHAKMQMQNHYHDDMDQNTKMSGHTNSNEIQIINIEDDPIRDDHNPSNHNAAAPSGPMVNNHMHNNHNREIRSDPSSLPSGPKDNNHTSNNNRNNNSNNNQHMDIDAMYMPQLHPTSVLNNNKKAGRSLSRNKHVSFSLPSSSHTSNSPTRHAAALPLSTAPLVNARLLKKIEQLEAKQQESNHRADDDRRRKSSRKKNSTIAQTGNLDNYEPDALLTEGLTAAEVMATMANNSSSNSSSHSAAASSSSSQHSEARAYDPAKHPLAASAVPIPSTVNQAMKGEFACYWRHAMNEEKASLDKHSTYRLIKQPRDSAGNLHPINVVSSKWVFAVKTDQFNQVTRFKARLVARGFSQRFGEDYTETFSPVLKYKTLRILLHLVCALSLTLEMMDVKTAYLNAHLSETIYMEQPKGYEQWYDDNGVRMLFICLLLRAIYGLKQAGREWNEELNAFVLSLGFRRLLTDSCVYVRTSRTGRIILISAYVDDIPSAYSQHDAAEWAEIKLAFKNKYSITFLGESEWLLNMRLIRDKPAKLLYLDQSAYVESLFEELNIDLETFRSAVAPSYCEPLSAVHSPIIGSEEHHRMRRIPYRKVLGLLLYLANTSRPDLSHSVSQCASFANNPGEQHWRAIKQIIRYLALTKNYALVFDGNKTYFNALQQSYTSSPLSAATSATSAAPTSFTPLTISAYCDADWAGCVDTRRSTTGWLVFIGNSIVDWSSKKQQRVSLSSCEAEYVALASAAQATIWTINLMKELLQGISLFPHSAASTGSSSSSSSSYNSARFPLLRSMSTPHIHIDNRSALLLSANDVAHHRTKHIDIKHHFIRERVRDKELSVVWISNTQQRADILTKQLHGVNFTRQAAALVTPLVANTHSSAPSHRVARTRFALQLRENDRFPSSASTSPHLPTPADHSDLSSSSQQRTTLRIVSNTTVKRPQ